MATEEPAAAALANHLTLEALIAVARDPLEAGPALSSAAEAGILPEAVSAAAAQRLVLPMEAALEATGLPVPDRLRRGAVLARARRLQTLATIPTLASALGDLRWVVMKGLALSLHHRRPDLREFNDLDVLVAGSGLDRVLARIEGAGGRSLNRNWAAYLEHRVAETPVMLDEVRIDLHWQLIALGRDRSLFRFRVDEMLERSRLLETSGPAVPTFDAVDQMVHLCVHAGLGGANRMGWLRDIHEAVIRDPPDWTELMTRSRQMRAAEMVGQVLDRTRQVLGTPVPSGIVEELARGWLLRVRRRMDRRVRPSERLRERSHGGMLVAASRDRLGAMLAVGARQLRGRLADRMGRPARWDVEDPGGPLYWKTESGDPAARLRYLEMAAEGA